jgi:nucleoside-diphosphate-sugar epimerase
MSVIRNQGIGGKVINIGDNVHYTEKKGTTILELANLIIRLCGKQGELEPVLREDDNKDARSMHRFPSTELMTRLINYRCRYNLERGLKETIDYYRKGLGK